VAGAPATRGGSLVGAGRQVGSQPTGTERGRSPRPGRGRPVGVDGDRSASTARGPATGATGVTYGVARPSLPADRPSGRGRLRLTGRGRRVLVVVAIAIALLIAAVTVTGYVMVNRLPGKVARTTGAFDGIPDKDRPAKAASDDSLTFIMVGSDAHVTQPTTGRQAKNNVGMQAGQGRTDAIMVLHISGDRHSATVVSIPRDSWVTIPGRGRKKINAAYALGGAPLLVLTVEQLTQIRIDHFAVIDFVGFRSVIDAIGGVDVNVAQTTSDVFGGTMHSGRNHLDGHRALNYVRERHNLPGGDFDRVKRQQNLLRAVMNKIVKIDPLTNPVQVYKLLDAGTDAISVDSRLSDADLRSLAFSLRGLQIGGVTFLTAPVTGTGMEDSESVVYLDQARCGRLWTALKDNKVADYVAANRKDTLPSAPR
jgi:LCP family protein required for cell wall assembly